MNLEIREASIADIPVIHELAVKIWNDHYPAIISQKQIDYMLDLMYSATALKKQMTVDNCTFTLLFKDSKPLGYISIGNEGSGEYFLHKFYIDVEEHNKGLGAILFKHVEEKISPYKRIRLYVNRENYKPINFYFKMGFTIEKVVDMAIGNGFFMNDFVLLKKGILR